MENRSHAIFAGIFVIVLVVAGIVAAFWIDRKDVVYTPYKLVSIYPVGGLSMQSDVRYMGVNVGKVLDVGISADQPGSVNILIGLVPGTPVTPNTWAEIVTQGVTGISNIELRDKGGDKTLVSSSESNLFIIPVQPGFFQQLQKLGTTTISDIDRMIDQLEKILTPENAQAISQSLQNSAKLTESLNRSMANIEPALKKLPQLVNSVDAAAKNITELAKDAAITVQMFNAPQGPIEQAARSLDRVQRVAEQLQFFTLPEINQLADSFREAAQAFTHTARELRQSPQAILYGPPQVSPGPGEAGFTGFGSSVKGQ